MAASATCALKAGVWFRRARLLIVSPDSRANLARRQAEIPLIALFRFPEPALSALRRGTNPRAAATVIECQANETHHASCRFYGARHRGICAPGSYPFRP